jgi:hypothetical protein
MRNDVSIVPHSVDGLVTLSSVQGSLETHLSIPVTVLQPGRTEIPACLHKQATGGEPTPSAAIIDRQEGQDLYGRVALSTISGCKPPDIRRRLASKLKTLLKSG